MNRNLKLNLLLIITVISIGCNRRTSSNDKFSTEHLITIIQSDVAPDIKREAIHKLGHGGDEEAVGAIVNATFDTAWVVRKQAILALKYFSSKKAEQRLQELAKDIIPKHQILAIESLYLSEKDDQLSTVLQFLKSDDPAIRSLAAQTFSYIPEMRFLNTLKSALEDETNPEVIMQLEKAITFVEQFP